MAERHLWPSLSHILPEHIATFVTPLTSIRAKTAVQGGALQSVAK